MQACNRPRLCPTAAAAIAATRSSGTRPLSMWCGSWADGEPDDATPVWSSPDLGDDRRGPLQWHLENVEATITGWSRKHLRI